MRPLHIPPVPDPLPQMKSSKNRHPRGRSRQTDAQECRRIRFGIVQATSKTAAARAGGGNGEMVDWPPTTHGGTPTLTSTQPSYDRVPTTELRNLLLPGGFLESLPSLNRRRVDGTVLDVHLRVQD